MIEYRKARELMLAEAQTRGTEQVPTPEASERVLAEDVPAGISSPPFDKAAMDGYAVRGEDVTDLPVELEVVGEVFAGDTPAASVGPGQAAAIATGAPVPEGADTVVMVEHTEEVAEHRVRVDRLSGANICAEGEDVREGEILLRPGRVLGALEVGVAAAAGHASLRVYRRPSTALLCTGTEVVEPGAEPVPGQIYNANGPMLSALMRPLSEEFRYLGVVGDERERLRRLLRDGLEADLLLISGGVSVGPYDLVPETLRQVGVREVFHKIAVKPGKPTFFGMAGETLVIGMPGNPQSCFVIFKMLVEGALAAMGGVPEPPPSLRTGRMGESFNNKPARMNVMPCAIREAEERHLIFRHPYHGSADIVGPAEADGYFIVPRGTERVEEGESLQYFTI